MHQSAVGGDSDVILRVENLTKRYSEEIAALNGISISVKKGEFFVIMGPSGSGKTTLLKCLAGLLEPDSGKIFLEGNDITNLPPHKRDVSLIFQDYALFPHMNVGENVAFGLKLKGYSREKIREEVRQILKLVGLEGYETRDPRQLSGGEKQRVAIARALVLKPKVLLFDEPLANLDYRLQRKMEEELKLLHRSLGMTFIYVTHNQEQAMSLGDRIMIINKGYVEQIGTPFELYSNPRNVFTARFLGDVNLLRGKIVSFDGAKIIVSTQFGEFIARANETASLEVGKEVTYAVRPENVLLSSELNNRVTVKYVTTIFRGTEAEFLGELPDGNRFIATLSANDARNLNIKAGDEVTMSWNNEDAVVLTEISSVAGVDVESLIYGR
jgi:spermidine/putrescine transport system ATP-binding protein